MVENPNSRPDPLSPLSAMKSLDELAKKLRDREVAVALLEKSNEIGEMIDNGKLEHDLDCRLMSALQDLRRLTFMVEHARCEAMAAKLFYNPQELDDDEA
jgi:hypothetical protein